MKFLKYMTAKLIAYDLISPGKDYSTLHEAIKTLGAWWHCLDSTWIVVTSATTSSVRDVLKIYIDANDKLAVFDLGGSWATANLPQECNEWLRKHISA